MVQAEGMTLVAGMCALVAIVQCQCLTSTPSNSIPANTSDFGASDASNSTCKKVKSIYRPLSVIFPEQPLYFVMLPNSPLFNQIDSMCTTFFPLPDGCETFLAYSSRVYTDGSTEIESFVTKSVGIGVNYYAGATRGFVYYNLGDIGCGTYLRYRCPTYGYFVDPSFVSFGPGLGPMGNGSGKLTQECLNNARNLAAENGLDLGDVYLLPYNLPTKCVVKQICFPENTPLTRLQGGTCKANDNSSCYA